MQANRKKSAAGFEPAKAIAGKDNFEAAAKALGCEEDERAFEDKLRKIARATPKKPQPDNAE
jgi:hypothetical protein